MKKLFYLLLIPLSMGIMTSCVKDDSDDNPDPPEKKSGFQVTELTSTTVTIKAAVSDMKRMYFEGFGIKDASAIDMSTYGLSESTLKSTMQMAFYVVLSPVQSFDESKSFKNEGVIVGDSISYGFINLKPNTTYYYRVYQLNQAANFIYHDAVSFQTEGIVAEVKGVQYTRATIVSAGEFEVFLKRNGQQNFTQMIPANSSETYDKTFKDKCQLVGLLPGTTYQYYLSVNGSHTDTQTFTTKSLDLSGTSVEAKGTQQYGGCKGTWKFTITSDLARKLPQSKVRFGVAPQQNLYPGEGLETYSSNTSSPYNIIVNWKINGTKRAYYNWLAIEELELRINRGDVTEAEMVEYEAMIDEVFEDGVEVIQKPFVEIDNERVVLGNKGYLTRY